MIKKMLVKSISLAVLVFGLIIPLSQVSADTRLPETIRLKTVSNTVASNGASVFQAGKKIDIDLLYTDEQILPQSKYDIGVAREIKRGYLTFYEPVTTETLEAGVVKDAYTVLVPNISDTAATSTFIVYVKVYTSDNPDAEKFFVTKSFFIEPSENPFVSILYSNILQSTGKRFSLLAGPHIYDPSKESGATLATSTSLELTFESNTDTVLKPLINFKKLRSNTFRDVVEVTPIKIKKGQNYISIPLPTFAYAPGVYMGEMVFGDSLITSTVQFQFIVAGDVVTVGQAIPTVTDRGTEITYDIFGVPLDIDRLYTQDTKAPVAEMYDVQLKYMKGAKEVFAETQKVDFSTSTFTSLIPASINTVDTVDIKVISTATGKVVYEGTKYLYISQPKTVSTALIVTLAVLLAIALILGIVMHKKAPAPLVLVLAILAIASMTKLAEAVWSPESYAVSSANSRFHNEGVSENPKLYFNDNLSTRTFSVGQDLSFMFKMSYIYCANTGLDIAAGFSTVSIAAANSSKVNQVETAEGQVAFNNGGRHAIYRNTTAFVSANLGPVKATDTHLHAVVAHNIAASSVRVTDGYTHYSIPLQLGQGVPSVTANTSAECGGKTNLRWGAVNGSVRYDIYASNTSGGTYAKVGVSDTTSFVHTAGVYGQQYYYRVKSINGTGAESAFSNTASALTSAECNPGDPGNPGNPGVPTVCTAGQNYCASQNRCINSGDVCPAACGTAVNQTVALDQKILSTTPGLCAANYSVLPGSLFGSVGRTDDAWQWVCSTSATGFAPRVSCAADCAAGTRYCPASDSCTAACGTCPQGYTLDPTGACIPPDGRIIYFRTQPDTAAATCPAYWDTEVGAGAYMNCSIGGVAVDVDKLVAGGNGYPVQAGSRPTLTCEVKSSADDSVIKTVSATTRCFRPTEIIEE